MARQSAAHARLLTVISLSQSCMQAANGLRGGVGFPCAAGSIFKASCTGGGDGPPGTGGKFGAGDACAGLSADGGSIPAGGEASIGFRAGTFEPGDPGGKVGLDCGGGGMSFGAPGAVGGVAGVVPGEVDGAPGDGDPPN